MSPIYLDYNATTPIAPEVREAILPFLADHYGNPSSGHAVGRACRDAIQQARQELAELLGADTDELFFTAGGTESNNLALQGVFLRDAPPVRGHLIVTAVEHPAVSEPARFLERLGASVTVVPCNHQGVVDPASVESAIRPDTRLVSVMHANNEIGVLQPIAEIARICRSRQVLLHTDAAQSVGKVRTRVDELGVDLLTVAGHKLYAPKGVGALYVRRGVVLEPVVRGAGHERGLRPGTENTPYIVGLGAAARLAAGSIDATARQMETLRDRLFRRIQQTVGAELSINGGGAERLPNTLSINFPSAAGHELLARAADVCASTGSACHSGTTNLSATLAAIGLDPSQATGTVRLSTGRYTTEADVDQAADLLVAAWQAIASH